MKIISSVHPEDLSADPAELRRRFILSNLFKEGRVELAYWETDRTIIGGAAPREESLELLSPALLGEGDFCARRELGIINLGGAGSIVIDGTPHPMAPRDGLYAGRGVKTVTFSSVDAALPARFYLLSYPAHTHHPVQHVSHRDVEPLVLGAGETANERLLYKYFAPGLVDTCQLVMGVTLLAQGSVWNTFPPHTHLRRSEVYCYFDLPPDAAVFHLMGEPNATRHLVMRDLQAVMSPAWSIHAGAGTSNYGFVWGMGGENQDFTDMQSVPVDTLY